MQWVVFFSICAAAIAIPQQKLHLHMTEDERAHLLGATPFQETPEYDLTTPFEADENGAPHSRKRRDIDDFAYFKVSAFGEDYHLQVKHNSDLLTPGFFVQVAGPNGVSTLNFDTVEPCHFTGKLTSHSSSHVAVSDCDGALTGLVATNSTQLMLQPLPGHLVNSVANDAGHTHVVYKRSTDQSSTQTGRQHITYNCSVEGSIPPSYENTSEFYLNASRRGEPVDERRTRYVIEALVVTDSGLYEKHGRDSTKLTRYVVTLMNIASSMYNLDVLGFNVRLVLTRIYMFTDKLTEESQDLFISHDSKNNLEGFSRWQSDPKRYIADDSNPLHYDHAFLFISKGMCYGVDRDCFELGRAWIGAVCSRQGRYAASVNADKGLQLGFVFAHELGHNLGMYHDGKDGHCNDRDGFIMSPSTAGASKIFFWSECSKTYLLDNMRKNGLVCLKDCPATIHGSFGQRKNTKLAGEIYNRDVQCQLGFPGSKGFCRGSEKDICTRLWCMSPDRPGSCISAFVGAAVGTRCGSGKICSREQRCLDNTDSIVQPLLPFPTLCGDPVCEVDSTRKTINGSWSSWQNETPCSRSCGGGFRVQKRICDNPSPDNCGEDCKGEASRIAFCNPAPCPGGSDYRADQCSALNARVAVTDLSPIYLREQSVNEPCRLNCFSPSKRSAYFGSDVNDGTKCNNYTNNRCYRGNCQTVGCDNILNSNVVFDECRVCGGDGSTCSVNTGVYTQQQQRSGYYPVHVIPAGSRNIRVEEIRYSDAIVIAASVNGTRVLGRVLYSYTIISFVDTVFEYYRSASKPEVLVAKGPTTEDVHLEALIYSSRGDHFGLRYEYVSPTASTSLRFFWKPKDYGRCNSTCGGGYQTRRIVCRHVDTLKKTDDSDCRHSPRPQTIQECNTFACSVWVLSDWSPCSVTCGKGNQRRTATCKRTVKRLKCPRPKPKRYRRCRLAACN